MHALVWLLAGLAFVIGVPCLCTAMALADGETAGGYTAPPGRPTAVPARPSPADDPPEFLDPWSVPEEDVPWDDPGDAWCLAVYQEQSESEGR